MIGLDYIVASYLHMAKVRVECHPKKPVEISVLASDSSVVYDNTKSHEELEHFDIDTISPYGPNVTTHVGGLANGEIGISHEMRFLQQSYPALDQSCVYIDKITISIHVKPTVYIAREYPKGGCMYRAVMEHEKKHVAADRAIINKYTTLVVHAVDDVVKRMGKTYGPYKTENIPTAQQSLYTIIASVVSSYSEQMKNERRAVQQQIDSLQEYERVRALCPNDQ